MKLTLVIVSALLSFLLVHWAVALARTDFTVKQARNWEWQQGTSSAPELVPEPTKDEPTSAFEPLSHLRPGEELVASRFAHARSISEMNEVRRKAHSERVDTWNLARGPAPVWLALMIAAALDPMMLLIGAGAGFLALFIVAGPLRGVVAGVASASAGNSASELVLQSLQYTRPSEQLSVVLLICAGALVVALGANWLAKALRGYAR